MSKRDNDAPRYSALQALLDGLAIAAYDERVPTENEVSTVQPESRIIVASRGRRDKASDARKEAPVASS
jgi:hypothetical protein